MQRNAFLGKLLLPIRTPREKDTKADNFLERMVNYVCKSYLHKETSLLFL